MKLQIKLLTLCALSSSLLITSCSLSTNDDVSKKNLDYDIDSTSALNTEFEGRIFSIPSPIQTAILLNQIKTKYNANLLNNSSNVSNYATTQKRALNLGIYGADLGYATLFGQQKESLNYLKSIQELADGLSISGAFDKSFIERFENNINKQDSLLSIVQDAYRTGDNFLKNNKQKNISALILTGGWIESMYFAVSINAIETNERIVERIGEQKQSLETIISILKDYNTNEMNNELIKDLQFLNDLFNLVEFKYVYSEPTTQADKKITTFNHSSSVVISDELLKSITNEIIALRRKTVG
jgi:hypothetical protein